MDSPFGEVKAEIVSLVEEALGKLGYQKEKVAGTVDFSKSFGDISCAIAFKLSKELKKSPNDIAKQVLGKLGKSGRIAKVTADNGFINFHLDRAAFAKEVLNYSAKADAKRLSEIGEKKRVIIESPSANPVHPLHVGQLRNMLLGDSLSSIYASCGYDVEREDYIDDLGLQMVEAVWGFLHMNKHDDKKFDHKLGKIYVDVNRHMESNDIKEELSRLAQLMEQDGTYESKTAREVAEQCVRAQYETMFNYGVFHDVLIWESDILNSRMLAKTMDMLLKAGFIKVMKGGKYAGCTIIDLNEVKGLPKEFQGLEEKIKVLVRENGTPTYVAKDIAFHAWKFSVIPDPFKYYPFTKQPNGQALYTTGRSGKAMDFGNAKLAINIIDVKQSYPQDILRLAFRIMKRDDIADSLVHLAYGRVELEEGTLAGRKGTWMGNTADDLLEEATKKAKTLISDRFKSSAKEQERIAKSVALAAIKFEFLKMSPATQMTFSWKWALSFEGNSGPYCQYTYARAMRMVNDAGMAARQLAGADASILGSDAEFALIKLLSKSREVAEKAAAELSPNVLTSYAIDIAAAFSKFYEAFPVLKAGSDREKTARLALTLAFAATMATILKLLGIEPIERM